MYNDINLSLGIVWGIVILPEAENRKTPSELYHKRQLFYGRKLKSLTVDLNRLSNFRLVVFFAGAILTLCFYLNKKPFWTMGIAFLTVASFITLVFWHQSLKARQKYLEVLRGNYDQAVKRMEGEWKSFADLGDDFKDPDHPYALDLDIVGYGSLYQWITTAKTFRGREKLKRVLTEPPETEEELLKRQRAILELAGTMAWRQRFLAEATLAKRPMTSPAAMFAWAKTYNPNYLRRDVLVLARALPLVTLSFLFLYFFRHNVSYGYPLTGLVIQAAILFIGRQRGKTLNAVHTFKEDIRVYERMLERFEKRFFKADYLQELRNGLRNREDKAAFEQIRKLSRLADLIANRGNAMFLIVNILTLWDIQCMISLEAWKERSGRFLESWVDTLGELEALSSLAIVAADHPEWCRPVFTSEKTGVKALQIAHPLLKNPVCNDLTINKETGIILITGSNMSGKSTMLRTVGINLVLAYAGVPVCAREFSCSLFKLFSCMRVSDNLGENISSFYAELLRIKKIVEASKQEAKIFFLLDEIFKGTNSEDRHAGAKILIRQLSKAGAMGMVSTHDLELGDLESESSRKIRNYHFREYYKNEQIFFDYKLRPGISTTRNAMYLIKMAGIDVDESNDC
ncbi:mismatch repair ATPase (MutS family) [Desulfosporosinus acidiphilus SJ4]|uniref:Mismatch repair ATPase (MutS family) n=1 Tax=Desulfosporosinus acidiphilus (strain DSM 22704 / JCM 16185 / SJ4) TaxID=646529 RepID=I4D356_DESAJ|nr:MutS family DNA mismatch repair protein [Desulfosporosinus acidiphilus]AFM40230.1 mismatch repair ATPase (MutS family) [Desulfosporosinus acidiphilus SJ4]